MPYVYAEVDALEGTELVGSHSCVALLQHYAKLPHTSMWKEGDKVLGNRALRKGTAIATFVNGRYPSQPSGNHACFFLAHTSDGFWVMDQWKGLTEIIRRPLRSKGKLKTGGYVDPSNNAAAFSVIK